MPYIAPTFCVKLKCLNRSTFGWGTLCLQESEQNCNPNQNNLPNNLFLTCLNWQSGTQLLENTNFFKRKCESSILNFRGNSHVSLVKSEMSKFIVDPCAKSHSMFVWPSCFKGMGGRVRPCNLPWRIFVPTQALFHPIFPRAGVQENSP